MKPQITEKQLVAMLNLVKGLREFEAKGLGTIKNLSTFSYFGTPTDIYIKYEKEYISGGNNHYEFSIAKVDADGNIEFIDDKFKNMFERFAFLGECKPFDIENQDDYEKID